MEELNWLRASVEVFLLLLAADILYEISRYVRAKRQGVEIDNDFLRKKNDEE